MTVGELRRALAQASDDVEIKVESSGLGDVDLILDNAEFVRGRKRDVAVLTVSTGDES